MFDEKIYTMKIKMIKNFLWVLYVTKYCAPKTPIQINKPIIEPLLAKLINACVDINNARI